MVYKPTYNWGAQPCRCDVKKIMCGPSSKKSCFQSPVVRIIRTARPIRPSMCDSQGFPGGCLDELGMSKKKPFKKMPSTCF